MSVISNEYIEFLETWRKEREARLQAEDGWLSVAGLHWLSEGPNTVGTDEGSDVRLPGGFGAVGVLHLREGRVEFEPRGEVLINQEPARRIHLAPDTGGQPDKVSLGAVRFVIVHRGERWGVRVFDNASPRRTNFTGLSWFPMDANMRVLARFEPHPAPRTIPIVNLLGDVREVPSPGYAVFEMDGQQYRLLAESSDREKYLFFNFRDATSGHTTYPPGRFLTTEGVQDGRVILDFNQAINPPCAFTPFATCPLAPLENRLPVAIEAGEKYSFREEG
jgi:uncharacterized protein (DUF1684 family)